jgi:uncharacterized protein
MLEKLMPKSDEFFDDFDKQSQATVEGCRLLKTLLEDFNGVDAKVQAIKDVEKRGDTHTQVAFERLHKQFITPFDRADIHRLLGRIDDVLDLAYAAAERVRLYELPKPSADALGLAELLVKMSEQMQRAVKLLRDFKHTDEILQACKAIDQYEGEADRLLRTSLGKLFKSGADPLTIIKWKEIYDLVEEATDRCEDVANVIAGVVLEHA